MTKKPKTVPTELAFAAAPPPNLQLYALTSVLCLYGECDQRDRGSRPGGSGRPEPSVSMLHQVDRHGALGPGKPVNPLEFARSIYRLKREEQIEKLHLIGGHVLAENRDAVLWWRPAAPAKMWFKLATADPKLTALNGVEIMQPPVVFCASKKEDYGSLRVWALAANARPTADTPLFEAPYMNLNPAPHMCMGTLSDDAITKAQKAGPAEWERIFFDSNFSHTPPSLHHAQVQSREASLARYITFLEALRSAAPAAVPALYAQALVPTGKTLASVLQA
jgi:PRTRC genetic system protein B